MMQVHALASTRVRATVAVRAAIYGRVSSDQQAERHTIDSQVEALLARAAADGHDIRAELRFLDEGQSGASLIRPALERLRDVIALGGIDRLYVHSPDRLARKYAFQALLMEEFQRAGVEVIFLNHHGGHSPEDALLLQVQGMVAEYERAKFLERSRRGKRYAAQQGDVGVLGHAPYGYRYVAKQDSGMRASFVIEFEEAQVVRQVFSWIAQEKLTLGAVRRRLQDQGTPTRTGKRLWDHKTLWEMVTNPTYKGEATYYYSETSLQLIELLEPTFAVREIRFMVALLPVEHHFQRPCCVKRSPGQHTAQQHFDLRHRQAGSVFLSRHWSRTRKKCARMHKVI